MDTVLSGRSLRWSLGRGVGTLALSMTPPARIALIVVASFALLFETAAQAQEPSSAAPSTEAGAPAQAAAVDAPAPAPPPTPIPAAPPPPAAPPAFPRNPRFGDPGQVALDGALGTSFGRTTYSATSTSVSSFGVAPAFDYFSTPNVSVGVSAFLRYSDVTYAPGSDSTTWTYGVSGQVGINLWLNERVSFWPKLALGGSRGTTSTSSTGVLSLGNTTMKAVFVELDAPFLFHVAEHFYVGFGPTAYADLFNSIGPQSISSSQPETNLRRSFGASSTVGGWF